MLLLRSLLLLITLLLSQTVVRAAEVARSVSDLGIWYQCHGASVDDCCAAWLMDEDEDYEAECRRQAARIHKQEDTWMWWKVDASTARHLPLSVTTRKLQWIEHSIVKYGMETGNQTQSAPLSLNSIAYQVSASLSETGGMHREYTIRVKGPLPADFYLQLVLHLPESILVNLEQSIVTSSSDVLVFVDSADLIHQEAPALRSPQHALVVTIKSNPAQEQGFSFQIQLDARYPVPLNQPPYYQHVVILPPLLRHGGFYLASPDAHATVWHMATGVTSHTLPVLWVTMVVAVGGVLVIARDTASLASQLSKRKQS